MHRTCLLPLLLLPSAALAAPPLTLTPADEAAAFRAAGFKRVGGQWRGCGNPGTAGYTPGAVEQVVDINGDGRPEAVVTEGSGFCFGHAGVGYTVVSKQAPTPADKNGTWKRVSGGPGFVTVLATKGSNGWADLEIGGPGFCFPVLRWNGSEYALHRHEYEGKSCKP